MVLPHRQYVLFYAYVVLFVLEPGVNYQTMCICPRSVDRLGKRLAETLQLIGPFIRVNHNVGKPCKQDNCRVPLLVTRHL